MTDPIQRLATARKATKQARAELRSAEQVLLPRAERILRHLDPEGFHPRCSIVRVQPDLDTGTVRVNYEEYAESFGTLGWRSVTVPQTWFYVEEPVLFDLLLAHDAEKRRKEAEDAAEKERLRQAREAEREEERAIALLKRLQNDLALTKRLQDELALLKKLQDDHK